MKTYNVTIQATVTKTYTIEANSEETATEFANQCFSVLNEDGVEERYDQQIIDMVEI